MFIEYVFNQFLYALLPFFILLYIVEALRVFRLKRRKLYFARLTGCFIVGVGLLFLLAMLAVVLSPYFIAGALVYVLIFIYTLLAHWFCFDESFLTILFAGVAAYSTQNLAYRVFSILEVSGVIWTLAQNVGFMVAYQVFQNLLNLIIYLAVYFIFIRRMNRHLSARSHDKGVFFIAATMLTVTVLLCAWTNTYSFQHKYLLIINYLFSIICCLFILAVQSGMLERSQLKRDIDLVNQMWERDRQQYELTKENIERINVLCHDLKHKIKRLRLDEGGLSDEEVAQFEKVISLYDSRVKTGFEPVDVILTEKSLYCHKNKIKFTCLVNGPLLNFIKPSDLYSLFGNILSNAIEAVSAIEDEDRRSINFTVRGVGGTVLIQAENFYNGKLVFKDGTPQSQKGKAHGYGIKSVQLLVEKYGG